MTLRGDSSVCRESALSVFLGQPRFEGRMNKDGLLNERVSSEKLPTRPEITLGKLHEIWKDVIK